ncbi:hypothetical protein [Alloyangia pacifica]|uniref:hypothetical protein n=1 Tax=Alloyangia pacifica TaxID=311180 RepID=UPI001CFCDBBD|nr:hypothetical protein [Alloyangia pacifica]
MGRMGRMGGMGHLAVEVDEHALVEIMAVGRCPFSGLAGVDQGQVAAFAQTQQPHLDRQGETAAQKDCDGATVFDENDAVGQCGKQKGTTRESRNTFGADWSSAISVTTKNHLKMHAIKWHKC